MGRSPSHVEVRFLTRIQLREDGLLTGTAKRKGLVGQIVNLSNIDTGLEKTDFYMVLLLRLAKDPLLNFSSHPLLS